MFYDGRSQFRIDVKDRPCEHLIKGVAKRVKRTVVDKQIAMRLKIEDIDLVGRIPKNSGELFVALLQLYEFSYNFV